MKAFQIILILCLLACFNTFQVANFIFCLLGDSKVAEVIKTIIDGIKDKKGVFDIILGVGAHVGELIKMGKDCFDKYDK